MTVLEGDLKVSVDIVEQRCGLTSRDGEGSGPDARPWRLYARNGQHFEADDFESGVSRRI